MDYEVLKRLLSALETRGVRYAIFGGIAPNLHGSFHIDIVTRLGQAFTFADLEVERVPFEDITVPVVTARTLYRMKKDTVRLKDRADAELLRRRFPVEPE